MIDLKGHSALITGSSSGVGRAIALAFAEAGADVLVHGLIKDDAGISVVESCRKFGGRSEWIDGDLSQPDSVSKLFEAATRMMPNIDILGNNAGWFRDVAFTQMTPERFQQTIALNVTAPYFLTQCFAQRWIANNIPGRVLMTGSINGRLAEEGSTAYDTSKGAVEMMVKTLAVALAKNNIRVNGIAPGLVRTAATQWLDQRPTTAKWLAHHTPNGQIPGAEVCGPAAVYLCSDAAEHITGQMLLIDGGMSAGSSRERWSKIYLATDGARMNTDKRWWVSLNFHVAWAFRPWHLTLRHGRDAHATFQTEPHYHKN